MNHLRSLLGLALTGYGLLVLLGLLAHEAPLAGLASLILGLALLARGVPAVPIHRASLVAVLGIAAVGGVLVYNHATRSSLSLPEWGILAYGISLIAASRCLEARLGRVGVTTLVAWSFPLLFAPLVLYALRGIIAGPAGPHAESLADPIISATLVAPLSTTLSWMGMPTTTVGNNLVIPTSEGTLTLGVGLICAGIYPAVLLVGVIGLHAWRNRLRPRLIGLYLSVGLVGVYLVNLLRLVLLAHVGAYWGGQRLQTAHAHLGWVLFALFMIAFWFLLVRRVEGSSSAQAQEGPV